MEILKDGGPEERSGRKEGIDRKGGRKIGKVVGGAEGIKRFDKKGGRTIINVPRYLHYVDVR